MSGGVINSRSQTIRKGSTISACIVAGAPISASLVVTILLSTVEVDCVEISCAGS